MKPPFQRLKHDAAVAAVVVLFVSAGYASGADAASKDLPMGAGLEQATLAGGCFWCMQADFEKTPGVKEVVSGYVGGTGRNPTYEDYAEKGYLEAVRITFDPSVLTYKRLLDLFWLRIDPTDAGGQFCDRGHQYTSAIFYYTEEQRRWAEQSKAALQRSGLLEKPVATKIIADGEFYPAEDYHQQYHKKHPLKYRFYRFTCGRDLRLDEVWGAARDDDKEAQ